MIQGLLGIISLIYLFLSAQVCVFYMVLSFVLCRYTLGERLYLQMAKFWQESYLVQLVFCLEGCVNIKLRVTGTKPVSEPALVLANHQTHDWVVMYSMAIRTGTLGLVRTVIKKVISYVPGFGWGMWMCYWPFVSRNYNKDVAVLKNLFAAYKRHTLPVQLWLYAEGTRLTPSKLKDSQEYAKSKGYPVWNHVMLPKHRGFTMACDSLKGVVSIIHELTLSYEGWGKPPGLWDIVTTNRSKPHVMHVHMKRTPLEDVPADEEGKKQWLMDCFARKEALLEEYAKNGKFPGPDMTPDFSVGSCLPHLMGWMVATVCTFYAWWYALTTFVL